MWGGGLGLMRVWPLYSVCEYARRCPQFWLCSFVFCIFCFWDWDVSKLALFLSQPISSSHHPFLSPSCLSCLSSSFSSSWPRPSCRSLWTRLCHPRGRHHGGWRWWLATREWWRLQEGSLRASGAGEDSRPEPRRIWSSNCCCWHQHLQAATVLHRLLHLHMMKKENNKIFIIKSHNFKCCKGWAKPKWCKDAKGKMLRGWLWHESKLMVVNYSLFNALLAKTKTLIC